MFFWDHHISKAVCREMSDVQARTDYDIICHVHGNKLGELGGYYDRKTGQLNLGVNYAHFPFTYIHADSGSRVTTVKYRV
jgi:hypothetical protein